jgi:hypothetical protein
MAKKSKKNTKASEIGGQEQDNYKQVDSYEVDAYKLVYSRMSKGKEYNDNLKINMETWMDMFMSRMSIELDADGINESTKYRSRLASNVVEKTIRALLAKYVIALLMRKPFFDIHPREITDQDLVERVKALLEYTFDKMPDFLNNMITFIQEMLIFGTAIGKVYWRKVVRKTKKGEVIEYEGAYFEPIHRENFFIDPSATKLDGFWKVHQTWKTLKQLKETSEAYERKYNKPLYKNLDSIHGTYSQNSDGFSIITYDIEKRGLPTSEENLGEYQTVKLWEYWSEDNSRVIIIANESIVLYDGDNPHGSGMHPFVRAVYSPVPFEFDGRGICEQVHDDYVQLNCINNQIMENTKLANNGMFIGLEGDVLQSQIVARVGKIIKVRDDINSLKPLQFNSLTSDVYALRNHLERKMEELTGSTSSSSSTGAAVTKEQSATEMAILNRLGNEYHSLTIMMLEVPALLEIVRKSYLLIQQYATETYVFNVTGQRDWNILNPDELQDFDIVPKVGVDVMSPEAKASFLTQLVANMKDIPGIGGQLMSALIDELGTVLGIKFDKKALEAPMQPQTPMGGQPPMGGEPTGLGAVGDTGMGEIPPQAMGGMTSRPGGAQ